MPEAGVGADSDAPSRLPGDGAFGCDGEVNRAVAVSATAIAKAFAKV